MCQIVRARFNDLRQLDLTRSTSESSARFEFARCSSDRSIEKAIATTGLYSIAMMGRHYDSQQRHSVKPSKNFYCADTRAPCHSFVLTASQSGLHFAKDFMVHFQKTALQTEDFQP